LISLNLNEGYKKMYIFGLGLQKVPIQTNTKIYKAKL